jgi:BirA family biotin operon repressor/biotin-[acetyl-CoA-carboxylase] ligase
MKITLLNFDSIDSTNSEALKHARHGADEGLCIVALHQTAGRGRHGRVWVSERDAGLYLSIVLRPKIEAKYLTLITIMAGIAVHDTLSDFGVKADIKWVNDLLVSGKKICGILAETSDSPVGLAVVVGIGINIRNSNFPPEIAETATSIECSDFGSAGSSNRAVPSSEQLTYVLTNYLCHYYRMLCGDSGPESIIKEWSKRSTYFSGRSVRVNLGSEAIAGVTDGLESNGALRIIREDGTLTIVQAGEVETVRAS